MKAFNAVQRSVAEPAVGSARPGAARVVALPESGIGVPRFSFRDMRISARGPGGVLFGNVIDLSKVAKPTDLIWVPEPLASPDATAWGHFDVVLDGGQVVMTRRMRAEDAYAALEIVDGRKGVFAPFDVARQEGVGLASVIPDLRNVLSSGSEFMTVHPAIYGFQLGDAAALADAIGFAMSPEAFRRYLAEANVPELAIERALRWQTAEKGWYKILDAPLWIVTDSGSVTVERMAAPKLPVSLRKVAFLDFQALDDDSNKPIASPDFYPSVPALVQAFPAFERLNSFAETFAIVRWAKLSRAHVVPPREPRRGEARLVIAELPGGDLVSTVAGPQPEERAASLVNAIGKAGDQITTSLREADAPPQAVSVVNDLVDKQDQLVRLLIAQSQLKVAADVRPALSDKFDAIATQLQQQERLLRSALQKFSSKEKIVTQFLDKPTADILVSLQHRLSIARDDVSKNEAALNAIDDEDARLQSLAPEKRAHAQQLRENLERAERDYLNADVGPAEDAAENAWTKRTRRLTRACLRLTSMLSQPPKRSLKRRAPQRTRLRRSTKTAPMRSCRNGSPKRGIRSGGWLRGTSTE